MIRNPILAYAASLCLAIVITSAAARAETMRPLFVKVHADWCGTCTRLEPTWSALQEEFGERAGFVVLDVTDRDRLERARREAEQLGIGAFFAHYKASTGTIGILDARTGEPLAVMKGETDVSRYREALARARAESPS